MIRFDDIGSIYLVAQPVDMRKGIDGFSSIVQSVLDLDPFSDALFLFVNRSHNKLKCLYYDGTGFWLLYKRLAKGTFRWKTDPDSSYVEIDHRQLGWLLDGLDFRQKRAFVPQSPKWA